MRSDITQEQIRKYFSYKKTTGEFYRIVRRDSWGNEYKVKELITSTNNRGYFWVNVFGNMCLVHRLVILYVTGKHPSGEIDHINGDRLDNRWCNLRDVTPFENSRNQGNRKDNTSGCRGVTYVKSGRGLKRWKARISHEGIRHDLGCFMTKEEAIDARVNAEIDFGYHPNHAKRESWRR